MSSAETASRFIAPASFNHLPVLPWPPGYCFECGEHIREGDLFGRMKAYCRVLFCARCYEYWKKN